MRVLLLILTMLLTLGAVDAFAPSLAIADPIPAQAVNKPTRVNITKRSPHSDKIESKDTGMALLFWGFAAATLGGALFVVTRRNLIAAVMGMVGCFLGISAVYMMLYASFLSVIQMLVYAGAIMVLFVFVIMVLNRPEDEPWALTGLPGKALAGLAMLYLTFRLGQTVWSVKADANALAAPAAVTVTLGKKVDPVTRAISQDTESYHWGSTGAVGKSLFHDYLFPFEAISILLLAAVVGAIAVARPWKDEDSPDDLNEDVPSEVVS